MRTGYLEQAFQDGNDPDDRPVWIAYLRQSTEDAQGESFKVQYRFVCEAVAKQQGSLSINPVLKDFHPSYAGVTPVEFVGAFGDRVSGTIPAREREGFQQALALVESRRNSRQPVAGIAVAYQSRLTRQEPILALTEMHDIVKSGCKLLFADKRIIVDTSNFRDQMLFLFDAYSNNELAVKCALGTIAAMGNLVSKGYWHGGNPPPGYEVYTVESQKDNRTVNRRRLRKSNSELHNRIIPRLFEMYLSGVGLNRISQYATVEGLRTSPRKSNSNSGGIVSVNVLHSTILLNELYCGFYSYPRRNRKAWQPKKRKPTVGWGDRPPVVYKDEKLAYVSEEVFNAVRKKIESVAAERGSGGRHILTGLLKCSKHKTNLYRYPDGYYRCQKAAECAMVPLPALIVEEQVRCAFLALTCIEENARVLAENYLTINLSVEDCVGDLERELKGIRKKQDDLLHQFTNLEYGLSKSQLEKALRKLSRLEQQVSEDLFNAKTRQGFSVEELLMLGTTFYFADTPTQNKILRQAFRRVTFDQDSGVMHIAGSDLLHNISLLVSTQRMLPPRLTPEQSAMAASAVGKLIGGAVAGHADEAAAKEYWEVVGKWEDNRIVAVKQQHGGAFDEPGGIFGVLHLRGDKGEAKLELIEGEPHKVNRGNIKEIGCGGRI